MHNTDDRYIANKVSIVTMCVNLALSAFKLFAGFFANSGAMISDGVHSLSDVLTTIMVLFGVNIASLEADESHPYGHEKIESLVGAAMALLLFATAVGIGYKGVSALMGFRKGESIAIPGRLALIAAVVSIATQELMFWYARGAAKKINSQVLLADAWHHRSDALSSVGSFLGIGGAMLGYTFLDPVVSLIICLLIIKVAYDIFKTSVDQLVDSSADKETVNAISQVILNTEGVIKIDDLKTRQHSKRMYVDVEIAVDGNKSTYETHEIAHRVHDNVEGAFKNVKHIMVHVNPE